VSVFHAVKCYLVRQLIALDQAVNTLLDGEPDETLSSRLGRAEQKGSRFATEACEVLDVVEKDHCATSIEFDKDGNPKPHHLGRLIHELPRSTSRGTGPNVDRQKAN
jgi:hypothetical protein